MDRHGGYLSQGVNVNIIDLAVITSSNLYGHFRHPHHINCEDRNYSHLSKYSSDRLCSSNAMNFDTKDALLIVETFNCLMFIREHYIP
jgi:hypothetical protein